VEGPRSIVIGATRGIREKFTSEGKIRRLLGISGICHHCRPRQMCKSNEPRYRLFPWFSWDGSEE